MNSQYQDKCCEIIERIINIMQNDATTTPDKLAFTKCFYESLSLADLLEVPLDIANDIAELVYEQVKRVEQRQLIHISNPEFMRQYFGRNRLAVCVINEDKPFLVDSLSIALKRLGFTIYRIIHPQLHVERDANGNLTTIHNTANKAIKAESCIYFELSTMPEGMTINDLCNQIKHTLEFVNHAVADWRIMLAKLREVGTHIATNTALNINETTEAQSFFDWLLNNNFIFLGYVQNNFDGEMTNEPTLTSNISSALGVCKALGACKTFHPQQQSIILTPELKYFASQEVPVQISKLSERSMVHRDVLMDCISIKQYDAQGKTIGENRFVGLFTSPVYYQQTSEIPYIRRKVANVINAARFDVGGHSGKALKAALEFFPRDELFQINDEELLQISLGIVSLEERPDIRLFLRHDKFGRFVNCFVYMPRDKFNTFVRQEIAEVLQKTLGGKLEGFFAQVTDSALARVIYMIKTTPPAETDAEVNNSINMTELNEKLRFIINYWVDSLRESLQDERGEQVGERLFQKYASFFPRNYVNNTPITEALIDIAEMEQVLEASKPRFRLFLKGKVWHLKMFSCGAEAALSDILPMLENMGFKVRDVLPHRLKVLHEGEKISLLMRNFSLNIPKNISKNDNNIAKLGDAKHVIEAMLGDLCIGVAENDRLNMLAVTAGLDSRQVMLLRSYCAYVKQTDIGYSLQYIHDVLCGNANIAKLLAVLFAARFELEGFEIDSFEIDSFEVKEGFELNISPRRDEDVEAAHQVLLEQLANVDNIAEDRIIRALVDTIQATLRTNFFQTTANEPNIGQHKKYISFKLDSHKVPNLPKPLPLFEIFVYSQTTEGVHLRGGKVARGGLRWSDRHQDFRTEVLGLMKAQLVKNTVIVPTGSKGGFISKAIITDANDRNAKLQAGIASYQQFLSGLLDLTDNRVGTSIVSPAKMVRYDEDDPYLVVAADKGTATFSDIANLVARNYGFWLDDAFASGGSVGYDHKKMGITAKGAWISVERHFTEMGQDIHNNNFSVVGIGDMSGDVFGNGMLLSDKILLQAAFNHLHIFLDPNPDATISFAERTRLFAQARGSWDEYDATLISTGGGVFSRQAKTIMLSKQVQQLLGTDAVQLSPNEVIKLILQAEVDLLWNGGIGTYVKASNEGHEAAGDPSNNILRINANELRCKIVAEGGNLGLTQNARIEFARFNDARLSVSGNNLSGNNLSGNNVGGRINSDAIDNSAGVDCSDHEVNIKIAIGRVLASGELSLEKRNELLASMTNEVSQLVLRDNHLQNMALSISHSRAATMIELHSRFIRELERRGVLDRVVEHLPSDKALNDLKAEKKGLTRPELAVLLAYSKIDLYQTLSASKLVNSSIYEDSLLGYFPQQLQTQYADELLNHPLKGELVATCLTNEIVNRAGITYIFSINNDTGHEICNIVRAYTAVREIFGLKEIWADIEALQNGDKAGEMVELFTYVTKFLKRMSIWFLNNMEQPLEMEQVIAQYQLRIQAYRLQMHEFVSGSAHEWRMEAKTQWTKRGIPLKLAENIVALEGMISACDIAMLDDQLPQDLSTIGKVYYTLGAKLQLSWMRLFLREFVSEHHWDRLAVASAINELYEQQRRLTQSVLTKHDASDDLDKLMEEWLEANKNATNRFEQLIYDIKSSERHDMAIIMVALRQITAIK